jgi:tetratricopeptide (TPR) repeat protein
MRDDEAPERSWLVAPAVAILVVASLGGSGYCLWKWQDERQAARLAEVEREESLRLSADRAKRAGVELARARVALAAAIERDLWPAPADLAGAADALKAAEAVAPDAKGGGEMRALVAGFEAFGQDDVAAAKAKFRAASAGEAEALARYAHGRALLDQGAVMEASAEFGGSLQCSKDWAPARFFMAVTDLELEFERRALPELEKAALRWPRSPEVLEALGRCVESVPASDKARTVATLTAAIAAGLRDERVLEHWVRLGSDPRLSGVVAAKLEALLTAEPESAALHLARGRLLRNSGETAPAVAAYARAMIIEPVTGRRARLELAAVYLEANQPKDCLALVEPVSAAAPDDPEVKAYVAYAERQMGKDDDARKHFSESCRDGFYWSCEEACSLRDIDSCYLVRGEAGKVLIAEIMNDETQIARDEFVAEYERRNSSDGSPGGSYYRRYAPSTNRQQVHTVASAGSRSTYRTPSVPRGYSQPSYRLSR